jgi:hypothetical protein
VGVGVLHLSARHPAHHRAGSASIDKLKAGLILAAILAAAAPLPAAFVERAYSRSAYPTLQRTLTRASNRVPFALLDAAVVGLPLAALIAGYYTWRRTSRASGMRRALASGASVAATASAAYLLFLALWGMNYRRLPLTSRLDFDESRINEPAAIGAARRAVDRLNAIYPAAHAEPWPELAELTRWLERPFAEALRELDQAGPVTIGPSKPTLLSPYMRSAGVDGVTNPFGLDFVVNPSLLPIERAGVVAHEWAHLAGIADEGEATFVAWSACLRGGPQAEYSGWLAVLGHLLEAVPQPHRSAIAAGLADGPRTDLRAIAARSRAEVRPALRTFAWVSYDRFLKANRVREGVASYDTVARLILGIRNRARSESPRSST